MRNLYSFPFTSIFSAKDYLSCATYSFKPKPADPKPIQSRPKARLKGKRQTAPGLNFTQILQRQDIGIDIFPV